MTGIDTAPAPRPVGHTDVWTWQERIVVVEQLVRIRTGGTSWRQQPVARVDR